LGLIVIDYVQLINHGYRYKKDIQKLTVELKQLAVDLNVPVLVTSQLSRWPLETRSEKRPMLTIDFGKYESIVNAADNVIFIYRDSYYNPDTQNQSKCELILAKHKDSALCTFEVEFVAELRKFRNWVLNITGGNCNDGN
jgi:replicative DNA helicase